MDISLEANQGARSEHACSGRDPRKKGRPAAGKLDVSFERHREFRHGHSGWPTGGAWLRFGSCKTHLRGLSCYNVRLAILGKILRLFAYLFSGALCLAMIALSVVVLLSGSGNFTLEMIPWWTGRELARNLLCAGLAGLAVTMIVAISGRLPILMVLWTAAVLGTLFYGFYLSSYKYDDWDHFRTSLNLTGAAVAAFFGAVTGLFAKRLRQQQP
jgi:hypothetical protein